MSLYLGNTVISGVTTPIDGSIAIGQIISSIIPLTDAGLHLLDGSLIQGGGVYDAFVQYIANLVNLYPQCFTDETTWQNTVNSKGACGKFVYNSTNNTVRLPKITGFIEGTVDSNALGDLINAGLPNHTHYIANYNANGQSNGGGYIPANSFDVGAVIVNSGTNGESGNGNWTDMGGTGFSTKRNQMTYASSDNSIYGNSSTVQPQSIKVFYYIVIATTTKTDIEVDIDKIATDLNSKANDIDVVHKTGNEIINGDKIFTNNINRNVNVIRGQTPATDFWNDIKFVDNNGNWLSGFEYTLHQDKSSSLGIILSDSISDTTNVKVAIQLGLNTDGTVYTTAQTPSVSSNSSDIATTAYVNTKFQVVSTLPASPNSNVFYFIPE